MAGRPSSEVGANTGDIDWVNLEDNWRGQDAERLQERSIVRIAADTPNESSDSLLGITTGRVFFSTSSNRLIVTTGASAYKAVMASESLAVTDSTSTVSLAITGKSGFTFTKSDGSVSIGSLGVTTALTVGSGGSITTPTLNVTTLSATAGAGTLSTGSGGVSINTSGAHTVTLNTSSSGLTVNNTVVANGFTTTGTVATGNLTVTGTVSLATTNTGTLNISGTGTATTSFVSPKFTSSSIDDVTLEVPTGRALRVSFLSGTSGANFFYGSGSTIRNAWVVYGTDPGVGTVPEGTIWIS